jgi:hypothetical protein
VATPGDVTVAERTNVVNADTRGIRSSRAGDTGGVTEGAVTCSNSIDAARDPGSAFSHVERSQGTDMQATATTGTAHLGRLVTRTAADDRVAFRRLYAFLAMSVWRAAVRRLPNPNDAAAVTRSTFVEVWHLARHRASGADDDARAWLTAIAAGRMGERTRTSGIAVDDYDALVRRELRDLLGRGRAVVRTAPHTFINVDDLDHTIAAIAGSSNRSSVRLTGAVAPGSGRCC